MRVLLLLLPLLAVHAEAAKPRKIVVRAIDAAGEPVRTAVVYFDADEERHPVNGFDATWQNSVLYLPDGTEWAFAKEDRVEGWMLAAGYEPTRFVVVVPPRMKQAQDVTLAVLPMDLDALPMPSGDAAADVRRFLTDATGAVRRGELRKADQLLGAVDRGRLALEGDPFVDATMSWLELRTWMAHAAWKARSEAQAAEPTEEGGRAMATAQAIVSSFALEWRDYARDAGRPHTRAIAMCRLAAPKPTRCD